MKRNNKKRKGWSLRTTILAGLLCFVAAVLAVLWITQTMLLGKIYETIKMRESESVMNELEEMLSNGVVTPGAVSLLAAQHDTRVIIGDSDGMVYYSSSEMFSVYQEVAALPDYYERAEEEGGGFSMMLEGDARSREIPIMDNDEKNTKLGTEQRSMLSCRIVMIGDSDFLVVLTSLISPIESTISTIRLILIFLSIVIVAAAVGLAFVFSYRLSKPIVKLNEQAKQLAKADYSAAFSEGGPKEIAELGTTLNYAAGELAKTEQLQHELIANVSHDLRTPLTMIKGYAEVMRDIPGENSPENVQIIIDETEHLTSLVNDLLDVSRMQANVTVLKPAVYSITESISTVLLRYNKLRENEGFVIEFDPDREYFVNADQEKMGQVIYNLINNAVNYSGESRKIAVSQTGDGTNVRIGIRDYGIGIDESELPHIWDRYYRSKEAHVTAKIGTGLGLSIVHQVLELHHAKYGVNSRKNEGTEFWFELPLAPDTTAD